VKTCSACAQELPLDAFQRYWNNQRNTHYYTGKCRSCRSAHRRATEREGANTRRRERYAADPRYRQARLDESSRWRYGIELSELLEQQSGACAICYTEDPGPKGWTVDHDHNCCSGVKTCGNCIRGVLCHNCNVGLGHFRDNQALLINAAIYLLTRVPSEVS
jgi:hypothetical protein